MLEAGFHVTQSSCLYLPSSGITDCAATTSLSLNSCWVLEEWISSLKTKPPKPLGGKQRWAVLICPFTVLLDNPGLQPCLSARPRTSWEFSIRTGRLAKQTPVRNLQDSKFVLRLWVPVCCEQHQLRSDRSLHAQARVPERVPGRVSELSQVNARWQPWD